jgi:hypothetical protein
VLRIKLRIILRVGGRRGIAKFGNCCIKLFACSNSDDACPVVVLKERRMV